MAWESRLSLSKTNLNGELKFENIPASLCTETTVGRRFDELEKQPDGYKTGTFTPEKGDWWVNSNVVYHYQNNTTYSWTYSTSTGEINNL